MKINPLNGVDEIILGMSIHDIETLLGKPDDTKKESYGKCDSLDLIYEYENKGLTLTFSSDDSYILGSIDVYSPDALLYNTYFINLKKNDFIHKFESLKVGSIKVDDLFEEIDTEVYTCKALGLNFWLVDGVVDSITIFPNYDKSGDRVIWPIRE